MKTFRQSRIQPLIPWRFDALFVGTTRVAAVLGSLEILPFEAPADVAYASVRTRLEQIGKPIGGNDLLIAAQALALGYTLVTDDEREFARVEGLCCENWIRGT